MMKKVLAILLCVTTLLTLCACGAKDNGDDTTTETISQEDGTTSADATVTDSALKKVYDDCIALMPEMYSLDADKMYNSYGVNPEDCVECYAAISADGMLADEIWLIKAKDADALKRIEEAAKSRQQAKDEESITYSPEQNKVVKASKIFAVGDYFAFICSPDVDKLVNVCNEAAKNI